MGWTAHFLLLRRGVVLLPSNRKPYLDIPNKLTPIKLFKLTPVLTCAC